MPDETRATVHPLDALRTLKASTVEAGNTGEDHLALEFVQRHRGALRYVPGWGWMWNAGTHWIRDARKRHFDEARKLMRQVGDLEPRTSGEDRRLAAAKTVAAIVQLAHADQRIVMDPEQFDADPLVLNTPGGVVDLRGAIIRPHAEGDYFTRCTAIAPDFQARPTTWLRFLQDIFLGDAQVIGFVRRLLGYGLTGSTREQVIAFFHGDGANGKSTLLDTLMFALGDYAIKVPTSLLMAQRGERHPADVAQLCGVRLAVANEVAEGEHWDESRVKELTGDMKLTARFMRENFFQFTATHKFIIAANHRPQVRTMDRALRRRLLLVPFGARFDGATRDPEMAAKLADEAAAILAWIVVGAADWFESGLDVPGSVREATDAYAEAMDSLGLWLADCCRQTGDPLDSEKASLLYRSYADWKRDRGEAPVSLTRWGEQMRSRGLDTFTSNGVRYRAVQLTFDERDRIETSARNTPEHFTK